MNQQIESPAFAGPGSGNRFQNPDCNSKPVRKWQRILSIFVTGRSLNMFEGEREGDHALHSTVAGLQARGLTIFRKEEVVRGYMGAPTRVCRYWLAPESRESALELLGLPQSSPTLPDTLETVP